MDSSSSALVAGVGERSIGRNISDAMTITVNTRKTDCQLMSSSSHSARGAPTTCPPDPAAVAMASAIERFSSLAARPTDAKITPNPVPAIPNPTRTSRAQCCSGETAMEDIERPTAYASAPRNTARRSPNFSASAPKIGCPIPQARFWIAIAVEKSARGQPNSSAMGIWNTPNDARIAKLIRIMKQPPTRTGVTRGARAGDIRLSRETGIHNAFG